MKKILLVLSMLAFVLVAFTGCKKESKNMGKGKVMVLTFETNPTTGFDWEYKFLTGDDKATILLDKEDYQLNDDLNLVGAPSRRAYYFKAVKPGKQSLTFTYRRPWEGGETAYDVVYELNVDKNLNIECLSKTKGSVQSDKELSSFPNPTFEN